MASFDSRFWHPFADMHAVRSAELTIVSGDGVHVTDEDGRRYLDGTASLWNVNVGHGRTELADAAAAQMRELATYGAFGAFNNKPARELTDRLAGLAPGDGARIFLTRGGGGAPAGGAGGAPRPTPPRSPRGATSPPPGSPSACI